jgi:hypothetical protein
MDVLARFIDITSEDIVTQKLLTEALKLFNGRPKLSSRNDEVLAIFLRPSHLGLLYLSGSRNPGTHYNMRIPNFKHPKITSEVTIQSIDYR